MEANNLPPSVSVIVPVHNGESTVGDSLRSLFSQTLQEIEIVVIDDASSDGTLALLEELRCEEPRLKVIHLAENAGVHKARAAGLRTATAPWIGFLDADDFAKPSMYATMLRACEEIDADIALCSVDLVTPKGKFLGRKVSFPMNEKVENQIFERFCNRDFGTASLWNKLYKRDLIMSHGLIDYRWRQDANEDTLVNIGCFLEAKRISLVDEQLYNYVIHENSATHSADPAKAFCRLLRAYALAVNLYKTRGRDILDQITHLYSVQLKFNAYRVINLKELVNQEAGLVEAVQLIAKDHPAGLASLINRGMIEISTEPSFGEYCRKWCASTIKLPFLIIRSLARGWQKNN